MFENKNRVDLGREREQVATSTARKKYDGKKVVLRCGKFSCCFHFPNLVYYYIYSKIYLVRILHSHNWHNRCEEANSNNKRIERQRKRKNLSEKREIRREERNKWKKLILHTHKHFGRIHTADKRKKYGILRSKENGKLFIVWLCLCVCVCVFLVWFFSFFFLSLTLALLRTAISSALHLPYCCLLFDNPLSIIFHFLILFFEDFVFFKCKKLIFFLLSIELFVFRFCWCLLPFFPPSLYSLLV